MTVRTKIAIAVALALLIFAARPIMEFFKPRPPVSNVGENQLRPERSVLLPPEQLVKLINPPPSSTVLDLGAGYGMFTFPLAKATGESGQIFATDADPQAIAYLKNRVAATGARNVVPVQVKPMGMDDFYKEHLFDIVLASDVLPLIHGPERFFAELLPQIKKETGRLWIVDTQFGPPFTAVEFPDAAALRKVLRAQGGDSVLRRKLSPEVFAMAASSEGDDDALRQGVVRDLNRLLDDPTLWPEVQKAKVPLNQRETKVREYLAGALQKKGVFSSAAAPAEQPTRIMLRLLNRLVLQDMLQSDFWERALSIDFSQWDQSRPLLDWVSKGQDCLTPLQKAGYTVVREHQGYSYHRIWELKH